MRLQVTLVSACFLMTLPLVGVGLSGCGLVAGKALSEAVSSDKDLKIRGDTSPVVIGESPRRLWAQGQRVTGSWHNRRAYWTVSPETPGADGFVIERGDYVDFVATNEGVVTVRADTSVGGLGGSLKDEVKLTVERRGSIPSPIAVVVTPEEGPVGTPIVVEATVPEGMPAGTLVFARNVLGSDPVPLLDDGRSPDKQAGDGIYTGTVTLPEVPKPGPTRIGAYATDGKGNASNWVWAVFTVK
ncbi:MAG: choice-of-anchor X domain-containing protein [Armatimonadota bacterium]